MLYTKPIYMGTFRAMYAGDVEDRYLDIAGDLATGETISSVTISVADADGVAVAGCISNETLSDTQVDFRLTAPSEVGTYSLEAVFVISDGQSITRYALFRVYE